MSNKIYFFAWSQVSSKFISMRKEGNGLNRASTIILESDFQMILFFAELFGCNDFCIFKLEKWFRIWKKSASSLGSYGLPIETEAGRTSRFFH